MFVRMLFSSFALMSCFFYSFNRILTTQHQLLSPVPELLAWLIGILNFYPIIFHIHCMWFVDYFFFERDWSITIQINQCMFLFPFKIVRTLSFIDTDSIYNCIRKISWKLLSSLETYLIKYSFLHMNTQIKGYVRNLFLI